MTSQLRRKRPITAPSTRPTIELRPGLRQPHSIVRATAWAVALMTALDPLAIARQATASDQPLNTWTARRASGARASASFKAAPDQAPAANDSQPAAAGEAEASPSAVAQPQTATSAEGAAAGKGAAVEPTEQTAPLRWHARRATAENTSLQPAAQSKAVPGDAGQVAKAGAAENVRPVEADKEFPVQQTAALEPIPMDASAVLRPVPTRAYPARGPAPESRLVKPEINPRQQRRDQSTISSSRTRARTRSSVLMVSGQAEDPFRDPFSDEDLRPRSRMRSPAGSDTATPPPGRYGADQPGEAGAPARQPAGEEPPPFVPPTRPGGPPTPPPSMMAPERAPSFLTPEPTPQGQQTPCDVEKRDCRSALSLLKANTIDKIALDLRITGVEGDDFPCECTLGNEQFAWRSWSATNYTFKASGLCHKPLYFEDVQLERYGHSWNPALQSILSGAHFITCVAFLPYNMAVNPPNECMYTLGYYRPGSCAPYVIEPVPISLKGALYEAGFVATGLWILHLY